MSWIRGAATDYLDLSDILVAAASGDSVSAVGISSGGTGYTEGDILTVVGGTGSVTAQIEVTSVASGVIDGVRVYNAGAYTVDPSSPNSVTGGTGASASLTLTFANNGWTVEQNTKGSLTTVDSVVSAGTGYSIGDIITLAGGAYKTPATLTVATLTGSGVATVTISNAGVYDSPPSDPVAQTSVSPSGGTGATFNLTFGSGETTVVLNGKGGGTDEVFVGWRTLSDAGYFNWELHGMSGFATGLGMADQPGVSPGFWDNIATVEQAGAYITLHNTSINFFLVVTPYSIVVFANVGGAYFNMAIGWGDRFATITEYPYPMLVSGSTNDPFAPSTQSKLSSGLVDPWRTLFPTGSEAGPMLVRLTDGAWYSVYNADVTVSSRNSRRDRCVVPCQTPQGQQDATGANIFTNPTADLEDIIPAMGLSPTPVAILYPTPGTSDERVLFPATIVFTEPSYQVVMEIPGVFWVSAAGGLLSEDRLIVSGIVYRIFQNCNRSDIFAYLAVKEE